MRKGLVLSQLGATGLLAAFSPGRWLMAYFYRDPFKLSKQFG